MHFVCITSTPLEKRRGLNVKELHSHFNFILYIFILVLKSQRLLTWEKKLGTKRITMQDYPSSYTSYTIRTDSSSSDCDANLLPFLKQITSVAINTI